MRGEANAANRLTDGEAKFDQRGGGGHEKKIGRAIHGMFADIPNNAMTLCEVLGVAHEHGRIFKRRDRKIHISRRVKKREGEKDNGDKEIKREFF